MPRRIVTTRAGETRELAGDAGLSVMGADEDDLLDASSDRDSTSRLSCDLPFGHELDGLPVRIAAED